MEESVSSSLDMKGGVLVLAGRKRSGGGREGTSEGRGKK